MDTVVGIETPLNGAITFGAMYLLRKIPGYDKRPVQFDFLIPIVISAVEAGAAALVTGTPLSASWQMALTNLAQSVTAHKLLTDAPVPYNS